jgi:amino acid transporter
MYFVVSGGAYGLEDAVRIVGPRLTIALCLLVPLTLSLPTALMAAELTALMPAEGGFYFWVKTALGPFAGFAEAYLTLLYTMVDTAIYPVLFATYLGFVLPLGAVEQLEFAIAVVWIAGLLNLAGVRIVGATSVALIAIVLAPFGAMVLAGLPRLTHWSLAPMPPGNALAALGGGLTVVIWNFCGWENLSVIAGEIENPRRNYLRAVALALPVVALGYLLPLAVALGSANPIASAQWQTGTFAVAAARIGGPLLGLAIGVGGAASGFAMFEAALLWVSRMPFLLARERYLPRGLAALERHGSTPVRSILLCCGVFTVLVPLGFAALVILDVFFYMSALTLEMWALVRLRATHRERSGLFVIGGGKTALFAVALAPLLTWVGTFGLLVARGGSGRDFAIAISASIGAVPAYLILRWYFGGPRGD